MGGHLSEYLAFLPSNQDGAEPGHEPTSPSPMASGSFVDAARACGMTARAVALLAAHVLEAAFSIAAWTFIGAGALSGRIDRGWVAGWALSLASAGVCRLAARWLEGLVAVTLGGLLRERLMAGAMAIDPDVVRQRGASELLADALEVESVERLAIGSGFETVFAFVELAIAAGVLAAGAAPALQIPLLAGWIGATALFAARAMKLRSRWTDERLAATEELVEGMIAHRTRAVQQKPEAWHEREDGRLERYHTRSHALDRATTWLEAAVPRGYVVAALVALAPSVISGGAADARHAVTLGVVLYAGRALRRLTFGMSRAAAAWIGWCRLMPILQAAAAEPPRDREAAFARDSKAVLRIEDVTFVHAGRLDPVVRSCSFAIDRGEFVLLEGDPGSGKSTLASIVSGRRRASSGVILSGGIDLPTAGVRAWRQRVAAVPQYHDNHVLSAPLSFNLLLGRPLPHTADDLVEARQVCEELGLAPLIDRMPGGLAQMVGETGWQLSHGERSRLFLARALLQRPALLVLDETFAALDPENLRLALACVLRRAETALVIAHP